MTTKQRRPRAKKQPTRTPADDRPGASSPAARLDSLRRFFPSDAAIAELLDVSRAAPGRWRAGARPEPDIEIRLIGLETVVSMLATYLEPSTVPKWLHGLNPHLGDRIPINALRNGKLTEVVQAAEAGRLGVFA